MPAGGGGAAAARRAAFAARRAARQAEKKGGDGAPGGGCPSGEAGGEGKDGAEEACEVDGAAPFEGVLFPASLDARQRRWLHALAEELSMAHASVGEGEERRIWLSRAEGAERAQASLDGRPPGALRELSAGDVASDAALCQSLWDALRVSAEHRFAELLGAPNENESDGRVQQRLLAAGEKAGVEGARLTPQAFAAATLPLLEMEHTAEVAAAAEAAEEEDAASKQAAKGHAINRLRLESAEAGLMGRTLLRLVPQMAGAELGTHRVTQNDVVQVRRQKSDGAVLCEGVVYRLFDSAVVVAAEDPPDGEMNVPLRVVRLANEVTHARLRTHCERLARAEDGAGVAGDLVRVCFGAVAPRFADETEPQVKEGKWRNRRLDQTQREAVRLALAANTVALIHGPPGTGKTTAVVEYILQEVARGARVLACAASNAAVDNLVERLASAGCGVVRVGHPARMLPSVLDSCLDAKVARADNSEVAADIAREMKELTCTLLGAKGRERREAQRELRRLGKEQRQRQRQAVQDVLASAQVVATTLTGAAGRDLHGMEFDVCVVDEAAQALEAACWLAMLHARKAVLAGDHLQLPPTVQSPEAERGGLGVTLFQRLHRSLGEGATRMLTVQYRMHADICGWASGALYGGALRPHASVARHTLAQLLPPARLERDEGDQETLPVLYLIDTTGCDGFEETGGEGESKWNEGEAHVAIAHAQGLLSKGLAAADIGIIAPYAAQVARLRELRAEGGTALAALEISTVDGFQGREKEAIIITTTRSNDGGEVGFLADRRRMNVAVTRARRHCALVCDTDTVSNDRFLKGLVDFFEAKGEVTSAALEV